MKNEKNQENGGTNGQGHDCGSQQKSLGGSTLESYLGSFRNWSQAFPWDSDAELADDCFDQGRSVGIGGEMAGMVGSKMNILDQAKEIVEERGRDYGSPLEDFDKISKIWSVIFKQSVVPQQVALAMMGVKLARITQNEDFYHHDSCVDICGYVHCLNEVSDELKNSPYTDPDGIEQ